MSESRTRKWSRSGKLFMVLAPLALLAAGVVVAAYLGATGPTMQRGEPEKTLTLVETVRAESGSEAMVLQVLGTVVPAREVALSPEVSGRVASLSEKAVPGGLLLAGEEMLRLERDDYLVEVAKCRAALNQAQADLALEMGEQSVAREEIEMLRAVTGEEVAANDLTLRKPQLMQARAAVASAEADLRKAELDLSRTVVSAPFNALITELSTNLGSQVNAGDALMTLAGTDQYWIEASVPLDRVRQMGLDDRGMDIQATVISQAGNGRWQGRVLSFAGTLAGDTHMAKILVAVDDPLGLDDPGGRPMVLGDYVRIDIQGPSLEDVIALPRALLRDNDSVWVYDDGSLDIRPVEVAWKDTDRVYVTGGLAPDELVISSSLAAPTPGMLLTTGDQEPDAGASVRVMADTVPADGVSQGVEQ